MTILGLKETLQVLYNATDIPLCLVDIGGDVKYTFPESARMIFTDRFASICIHDFVLQKYDQDHPFLVSMRPSYHLCVLDIEDNGFVILGPICSSHCPKPLLEECISGTLYIDNRDAFISFLSLGPALSLNNIRHIMILTSLLCRGKAFEVNNIRYDYSLETEEKIHTSLTDTLFRTRETEIYHSSFDFEEMMCSVIENGNMHLLEKYMMQPLPGRRGVLSHDANRQEEFMAITAVTVFSRAAIRGGLDSETAYSLADIFCQQIELLPSPKDTSALMGQMMVTFCSKVSELKKSKKYSNMVMTSCDYIERNLHKKCTLKDMAEYCQMSEKRIGEKFKNETGLSVVDYIHVKKMEEAELLLKYSPMSINEICHYLYYSSQSYFTKIFKSYYHVTPQKYRDRHSLY